VLAWQIVEAMKAQHISCKRLAERMNTSRSQIGRLLDPKDGNVTIATLQRAARVVGRANAHGTSSCSPRHTILSAIGATTDKGRRWS